MKIEEAIQQAKPFKDAYNKAVVNCVYTASWLNSMMNTALKPVHLSMQQYNILRILKGQHPKSASIKLLTDRMLDKMSNSSRLVDKLVEKGLVDRITCPMDRRRVEVSLNQKGIELLAVASENLENAFRPKASAISQAEANQLSDLLDKMRQG